MNSLRIPVVVLFSLTSLAAIAAEPDRGSIKQDVQRLTLLPGPNLTSPPKMPATPRAPATAESVGLLQPGEQPVFRFQPAATEPNAKPAPTQAVGGNEPKEFAPAPKPEAARDPATLKFDAQLPPLTKPLLPDRPKPDTTPAPKRD